MALKIEWTANAPVVRSMLFPHCVSFRARASQGTTVLLR